MLIILKAFIFLRTCRNSLVNEIEQEADKQMVSLLLYHISYSSLKPVCQSCSLLADIGFRNCSVAHPVFMQEALLQYIVLM